MAHILVVDDERSMREFLEILLQRQEHRVLSCASAEEALAALEGEDFDLAISDIRMPGAQGFELLSRAKEIAPETPVVMITAHGSTESAVEAMKLGAYDYLTKPFSVDEICLVVEKALEKRNLSTENRRLRRELEGRSGAPAMIGRSARIREVLDFVARVAPSKTSLLVTGESGTGKELVARTLHALSERRDEPFVAVNCGAIPENLLESELFGHVKGSFTGAVANKMGLFEVADGGTLFLDEIGEMPLHLQVKLLRAIQDRSFKRVGGTQEIHVDVRILCATNRDLALEVRECRFREDLFYRLNVIEVHLPPLRERREDIPLFVDFFVAKYAREGGRSVTEIAPEVIAALEAYDFPGNVRELENLMERAVTLARGQRIGLECLPANVLRKDEVGTPVEAIPETGVDMNALLARYESQLLRAGLERAGGVKKRAAALLGVSFRSFRYRLEKLGLDDGGSEDGGE